MSPGAQTAVGLVLMVFSLLSLAGSVAMVLFPGEAAPVLTRTIGLVLVLLSIWGLVLSFRLVFEIRVQGGLMGTSALRFCAWFFLLLPLGGLFTGYFVTHTVQALVMTGMYIGAFFSLRSLAARRKNRDI